MGKTLELLDKLRVMNHTELLNRYTHVARAQAIREYIAADNDPVLALEVKLAAEEITNRMTKKGLVMQQVQSDLTEH